MNNNNKLEMALNYAEQGLKVFPLNPNTKIPLKNTQGSKEATSDIVTIKEWWNATPQANIGLVTSNFFVLDIDTHTEEDNGFKSLETLIDTFEELPNTFSVTTGNDGLHLYFKKPFGVELSQRIGLFKGIDLKAHENNYVVAPPSEIIRDDKKTGSYKVKNNADILEAPTWLIDLINRDNSEQAKTPLKLDYSHSKRYRSKTTHLIESLVLGADEGTRDNTITSITGSLLAYGVVPSVVYELIHFANSNFKEPLTEKEVNKTFKSIMKKEVGTV